MNVPVVAMFIDINLVWFICTKISSLFLIFTDVGFWKQIRNCEII